MMRSLFSGVSGLRSHQTRMDVIGNNIANVNTVGFKSSRVTFQDVYSQTLKAAGAPANNMGGTNPQQVGLGVSVGAIDILHTPAASERTDAPLDLAIEGDGFFAVSDGNRNYYTRAGNFKLDASGYLVTSSGLRVQGWTTQPGQPLDTNVIPGDINLTNISMPAQATDRITLEGNLDARGDLPVAGPPPVPGYTTSMNMSVYDSLGNEHKLKISFEKTANNTWNWTIVSDDPAIGGINNGTGIIVFNAEGKISSGGSNASDITISLNNGANDIVIAAGDLVFNADKFTQYAQQSYVSVGEMSGYPAGQLTGVGIDKLGYITGIFSNGQNAVVGVIPLVQFANPGGLSKIGDNLYENTANSGMPMIGQAGTGGRGTFNPGALEMSNVDLSRELTDMIITERGFQANSRIITTSDEMLQELVNLKR